MPDEEVISYPRERVKSWIEGFDEYVPPARILNDLTETQATTIAPGSPYSIAQLVAHMQYYQGGGLAKRRDEEWPAVEHLADTFAPPAPGAWPELAATFLAGLEEIQTFAEEGVKYGYDAVAIHNSYHLGQIVLLRQMLGCWPPEGGEDYEF